MVLARSVIGVESRGPVHAVLLEGSGEIEARALIVATGVSYRSLDVDGLANFTGRGVFYGATASEATQCRDEEVYIVGAANSAGQAALNLARYAKRVVLLVRGEALESSMSRYLIDKIAKVTNIEIRCRTEVVGCRGDGHLEGLTLADRTSGRVEEVQAGWLFVFVGASPRTEWLGQSVLRDDKGFVMTGPELIGQDRWQLPDRRTRWRPACRVSSRRATYGSTR